MNRKVICYFVITAVVLKLKDLSDSWTVIHCTL